MHNFLMFLQKYDVPGPRYTSYPTVPAWTESVTASAFHDHLGQLKSNEPLSLYFHLPFCESLCHFCGCMQVITKDHSRSRAYVDLVKEEVARVSRALPKARGQVSQLHFGGGTPNFLQPEELTELVETVQAHFTLSPNAEVAIEMHPRTSTKAFCENLARLPFNRISLGVQDFDPRVQKLINRNQTHEMTVDMVERLRSLGFQAINMDLVYGLPGQTLVTFQDTLDKVIALKPGRLAVYSYAHVPWVRPVQRAFKDEDLPSPELKLELFMAAYDTFAENGYVPVGMDHFALEDDDLARALREGTIHRNFMGYSTQADAHQIGFGVSAISYVDGHYFQNEKKLDLYVKALGERELATFRGCILSREDALRRDLIMTFMCRMAIDIPAFEAKWGISFIEHFKESLPHLQTFISDGLLEVTKTGFRAIGRGHLFLRNMAMPFDPYIDTIRRNAVNPTFSRTV